MDNERYFGLRDQRAVPHDCETPDCIDEGPELDTKTSVAVEVMNIMSNKVPPFMTPKELAVLAAACDYLERLLDGET